MKKNVVMIAATLIVSSLVAGCAQTTSSAERNAQNFVYSSYDDFDPNFQTHKYNSIQSFIPFFEQFWQQGKKDREAGMTQEDAQQRVRDLTSDEFLSSFPRKSRFAGQVYNENTTSQWTKAMSEAISTTYMDGYEGRN
ncbi:Exc2 family lipoprotein [Xenorhabdus bovienii]|uniref:Entry exclusion protein 2 n=2 Tax=Xenorhabdus bovienii TaxID=40576 RepID=A0A077PK51_XENBV|nr:Exc2 family lipoprotein [Xenorhabdus bovienii]MDE1475734.1 Exc2 family lipoprotein [Xenorhabdus bovienii]MDE1478163.1 Exc2 family lipoprotein [Xenorhabdus bovienii]MDE1484253.1 Exc2 family lipoprotein [Xenorhabdus bovienii]MDE1487079.1 Exc2 family lipoprotein [Xenorhabdus bovienii]MDE1491492.1 Exc2 family lipoprotein [Xenorhabdus bovienii]